MISLQPYNEAARQYYVVGHACLCVNLSIVIIKWELCKRYHMSLSQDLWLVLCRADIGECREGPWDHCRNNHWNLSGNTTKKTQCTASLHSSHEMNLQSRLGLERDFSIFFSFLFKSRESFSLSEYCSCGQRDHLKKPRLKGTWYYLAFVVTIKTSHYANWYLRTRAQG